MPVLWSGHRWEDCQVRIIDSGWNQIGMLGTTYKLRGVRSLYGQFKGELTLSLDRRDPWASVLLEHQVHFIQVLRDGHPAFEGFQIKLDREDTIADAERWIEFAFLPLAFMLHWRIGYNEDDKTFNLVGLSLDDAFKRIVRRTIGPGAGFTQSGLNRVVSFFSVQADVGAGPIRDIDATAQNVYEIIQQYASAWQVDWDIVFDANFHPQFQTYFPRRGFDRTETGPGPDSARCIFSDDQGNFVKQSYGQDTSDLKNVMLNGTATWDAPASAALQRDWLLREGIADTLVHDEVRTALYNAGLKEWYKLEQFVEQQDKQWQQHFCVGDCVTWTSNRLGYGPHDDIVCMMEFEIDEAGFEHLTPTFGKPEPDIRDNLRGGGRGKARPGYTAPTIWHIFADNATNLDPNAANAIGVVAGGGGTVTCIEDVANNQVEIEAVLGAACLWVRDNLDSGVGVTPGLHTGVAAEPVMIGADQANLTGLAWVGTSGGTKLDVRGLLRVVRGVYCNEASLALWGMDGGVPIVHIVDETGAVGGAGGGPCRFDVYNAAVRHHMLDADIARASYIRGFFEIHNAAGAIGHSFNAVTGAVILNEQGLNTGHVRIESVGNANMVYVDAANNRVGILDGAPGHTFDVGGDINIVTGSGLMINDTAADRHVLIGDGTRGEFRALVAADLPAIGSHWTDTGAFLHPTAARDVEGNAGGTSWELYQAGGALFRGAVEVIASFTMTDSTDADAQIKLRSPGDAPRIEMWNAAAVLNILLDSGGTSYFAGGNLQVHNANDFQVRDGAPGNLMASIDGATGRIDSADGYTVAGGAAFRHALMGTGVKGTFRALVAADLAGHVHAVTWDNVATGGGTNHSHGLAFGGVASAAGTNHSHAASKATATGTFTPGSFRTNIPVYDAVYPDTSTIIGYVHGVQHSHQDGVSPWTYGVTAGENAHTHNYDKPNTPTNNEGAHTHNYDQPNTPTGGPA